MIKIISYYIKKNDVILRVIVSSKNEPDDFKDALSGTYIDKYEEPFIVLSIYEVDSKYPLGDKLMGKIVITENDNIVERLDSALSLIYSNIDKEHKEKLKFNNLINNSLSDLDRYIHNNKEWTLNA